MNITHMKSKLRILTRNLASDVLLLACGLLAWFGSNDSCCAKTSSESALTRPGPATNDELLARIPATFQTTTAQTEFMLGQLKSDPKLPRTFENGQLKTVEPKDHDWGTDNIYP